jgi:large subunit ribosomal protein L15
MKLHELKAPEGSRQDARRLGRGIGSGIGKTSGKGHKGQKSRSGGVKGPYFEGGQTPLQRRLPKRGFNNIFKKQYAVVNLADLNQFRAGTVVTPEMMVKEGLVKETYDGIKVLGRGEVKKALTLKVHQISKNAAAKVEAAGGKVEVI